ncbi:flagellar protein FlaG [Desulfonatronovibrio hydrogenovorans]|uniref:flagellar protein FlaG n=1 Tax=Desulfonatronovibrio hydrogenovorans TaxID=53245 RepID=UPI00048BA046|nr:flagellar protein FlaG [Desulfonatronovibrio hydrogenovorans]
MKITEYSLNLDRPSMVSPGPGPDIKSTPLKQAQDLPEKLDLPRDTLDQDKLTSAVTSISQYVSSMGVKLKFNIHEESDQYQVEVVNPENDKVIRKIPPDELLDLAVSIEKMLGLFVNRNL